MHLVLLHGTADRSAELVLPEVGGRAAERVVGRQALVPEVPERAPAHGIRAALGNGVYDAAARTPELRRVSGVGHLEFLDGLLADRVGLVAAFTTADPAKKRVVVGGAVDGIGGVDAALAPNGGAAARGLEDRAGRQQNEILEPAAVDRQRIDGRLVDGCGALTARHLHERRFGRYGQRFGDRRNPHGKGDDHSLADLQHQAVSLDGGEALKLRRHVVGSERQQVQTVEPRGIARGRSLEPGTHVPGGYAHARHRRPLLVGNHPFDLAGGGRCLSA